MQRWIWMSVIGILAVAVVAAMGTNAAAGRGYGGGGGPCWDGEGGGMAQLSAEDRQKMVDLRQAFQQATDGLRREIYQKELALRSELAQETPDPQKAAEMQKAISGLEAQFDQKRLEHVLEMRKINPNGRGWMMGGGRGSGGRGMEGCPGGGRGHGPRCRQ
jgi:Spy/CpxP family protein refolding chaperone